MEKKSNYRNLLFSSNNNLTQFFLLVLIFISITLPFEDFLLKFIPMSFNQYIFVRQFNDFLILAFYFVIFLKFFLEGKLKIGNKRLLMVFMVFASYLTIRSLFNNNVNISVLANLKAILRYMPLVFFICPLRLTDRNKIVFIKIILILSLIEALIEYLQLLDYNFFAKLFAPNLIDLRENFGGLVFTSALAVKNNTGEIFGTFPYTINFSLFLLIGLSTWLMFADYFFKYSNFLFYIFIGIFFLIPICFSGSRIAFLVGLFIFILILRGKYGNKFVFLFVVPVILFFLLAGRYLSENEPVSNRNFFIFLSPEYINILKHQRLALIGAAFKNSMDKKIIFGLGPNRKKVAFFILNQWNLPNYMGRIIEDVYWLAFILYYGYVGFFFLIVFLIVLYLTLFKAFKYCVFLLDKKIIELTKVLSLSLIPLNFVNQAFEVKSYSFYLWLLCGLAFVCVNHQERDGKLIQN